MSKKAIVVLALMVLALGGYIALFERGSLSSKELEARKGKVLPTFVRDKVTRLTLTQQGQRVVLERTRDSDGSLSFWKMLEPAKAGADQDTIDQLLGELEWLTARRLLENVGSKDLETFGLDEPTYRVEFRVSGDDHVLRIGAADVHGQSHYARVDEDTTAFVVPKTVVEALDHDPGHFRTKQFLGDITSAWAQRVELFGQDGKLTLQKQSKRWWVEAQPRSYADTRRVMGLINALDQLRAVRYLRDEERKVASQALALSTRAVELDVVPDAHREDKKAERFVLRFAGDCQGHEGERYAQAGKDGDPVCVSAEDLIPFDATEETLRLSGLFDADPSEIEELELRAGDTKLVLKREGEKWQRVGAGEVDREAVESWLADLKTTRATAFSPRSELKEQITLVLTLSSEEKTTVRARLDDSAAALWVQRDDEPAALRFPLSVGDQLVPFDARFASLAPWSDTQPSQVVSIDARHEKLRRQLTLEDGTWQSDKRGAHVDSPRIRELTRQLSKLRVLSVVAPAPRAAHGLGEPRASVVLTLAEGPALKLTLGAETSRGSYAQLPTGVVVEVAPDVEQAVMELAGGERAPAPQPEQAEEPGARPGDEAEPEDDAHHHEDDGHDHF